MERVKLKITRNNILLVLGFLLIAIIYYSTMLPSLGFHDVGELQGVVPILQIPHPTGFPAYILSSYVLSFFLPSADYAWKVNLLSLIYTIVSLVGIYSASYIITKQKFISFISVVVVSFTEPIWNYAGMADTHSFGRMFLALLVFLAFYLEKKFNMRVWVLFSFVVGFSLGGHLFIIYAIPWIIIWLVYFSFRKKHLSFNSIILGLLFFFLGFSVYFLLPLRSLIGGTYLDYSLATWSGFIRHVSGSDFAGLMFKAPIGILLVQIGDGFIKIYDWLGLSTVILIILGMVYGIKKYLKYLILVLFVVISLLTFASTYPTSDSSRYFGWILLLCAIFITFGLSYIQTLLPKKIGHVFVLLFAFLLVYRMINTNYIEVDKHDNFSAVNYANSAFSVVEQNGVILSWWHYMTPLRYKQDVDLLRPDILIITKGPGEWKYEVEKYISTRSVYVVEMEESLKEKYNLVLVGSLYKVEKK